jgi:hypothetical protein
MTESIAVFPDIARPDYKSYAEGVSVSVRRVVFEGNAASIRRHGAARRVFTCVWNSMTNADKETLFSFFSENAGRAFLYTPPLSSASVLCAFSDDDIEAQCMTGGSSGGTRTMRWRVSVRLEEMTSNAITANTDEEEAEG